MFNIDIPEDYRGRSLSVSDIVAINKDGQTDFFYTDATHYWKITAQSPLAKGLCGPVPL